MDLPLLRQVFYFWSLGSWPHVRLVILSLRKLRHHLVISMSGLKCIIVVLHPLMWLVGNFGKMAQTTH